MKGFSYYVCPKCGSVSVSSSSITATCCGSTISPLELSEASSEALTVRAEGDELFITLLNPMTKNDYITFIAIESYSGVMLKKLYPEWNEDVILPRMKGRLVWAHSLGKGYYQKIR